MNVKTSFFLLSLIYSCILIGQPTTFEISGRITGESKKRIYLFYDNDVAHKDSIHADIKDGYFIFREKIKLPVLCRLHFGERTSMQEIYIDNKQTQIDIESSLSEKNIPDSLGGPRIVFKITSVKGSSAQDTITLFRNWWAKMDSEGVSNELKNSLYFDYIKNLVKQSTKSKISAYLIAGKGFLLGRGFMFSGQFPLSHSQLVYLRDLLDTSLQSTYERANIERLVVAIEKEKNRVTGVPLPAVFLNDRKGQLIKITSYRSKVVIIDIWASWCGPCRTSNKEVIPLYKKYKGKGLEIVGVSMDENINNWKTALKAEKYPWPQLIDMKAFEGELAKYYDIRSIPVTIILDEKGNIIGFPTSNEEMKKILKEKLL